ncbi:MAG: hypothetical protein D6813_12450 [Calditrichaeota bacterium]|nr:MAG: hypothetical protein D6813_12450 [Calditrichota bacterium]
MLETGRYDIHNGATGPYLGLRMERRFGSTPLAFDLGLTLGLTEDNFMALEPGLVLRIPLHPGFLLVGGVGAGVMREEQAGSPSIPYFFRAGVEIGISNRMGLLLSIRRGSHGNMGDPGTFSGPHTLSGGLVYKF